MTYKKSQSLIRAFNAALFSPQEAGWAASMKRIKIPGRPISCARLSILPFLLWVVCSPAHSASEETSASVLRVRVVDRELGSPIAAATVECQERPLLGEQQLTSTTTAADGACTVPLSHQLLSSFALRAWPPGHASLQYKWFMGEGTSIPSGEIELRIPRAVRVGGIVRNRASNAVSGAQVQLTGPRYEREGSALVSESAVTSTGADGKWQVDVAGNSVAELLASVDHPDYAPWGSRRRQLPEDALRKQMSEVVLEDGVPVKGRITGPDGRPVAGATVRDEQRPPVRTDSEGRFVILHFVAEEMSILQVSADGFASAQLVILPLPQMKPVEITLSRGHNFTIRVVDGHGKPVPGAVVRPSRRMKMGLLQEYHETGAGWSGVTTTDGCATWSNAPDGELIWRVAAPGFRRQEFTFAPESGNHTVTLLRPQHISGEVVEAGTGKKVDEFQVIVGSVLPFGRVGWTRTDNSTETGSNGLFDVVTQEARGTPKRLLILSPHHLPCMSGEIPAASDEITTRLSLVPGVPGMGRVLDPAGSPVSSASLCLRTSWSSAYDQGKGPEVHGAYPIFHTDPGGSFTLPPQDSPFTVAVWSDAGYAEKQFASTSAPLDLRLAPWAALEGELPEFEPGELVHARPSTTSTVTLYRSTAVDSRGRFTFPRLPPGECTINAGMTNSWHFTRSRFEVRTSLAPGAHETLRLGDGSGVVTGSVDLKTSDGLLADTTGDVVMLSSFDRSRIYRTPVAKDGTFRFKGVSGGRYSVSFLSNTLKPERERRGLAWGVKDVVVPEDAGTSMSEVNVGRLGLVPAPLLAGLPALEITTISPEGREIRLSDFRGRWVVVDFWAEWCGGCIWAMRDTLKPMWQRYRDGGRLVIYSVALTENQPACVKLIKERNFDWTHGFAKGRYDEALSTYQIMGVPTLYLINPQGVVVAADVEEDELVKRVAELVK